MCGIAGFSYIKPDKKISKRFFNTEKYLFHRGPENTGFFKNPHLDSDCEVTVLKNHMSVQTLQIKLQHL